MVLSGTKVGISHYQANCESLGENEEKQKSALLVSRHSSLARLCSYLLDGC